jgi:hypothetical protein
VVFLAAALQAGRVGAGRLGKVGPGGQHEVGSAGLGLRLEVRVREQEGQVVAMAVVGRLRLLYKFEIK